MFSIQMCIFIGLRMTCFLKCYENGILIVLSSQILSH